MTLIDISRPRDILAICPACGRVLHLPLNWQDITRQSMDPLAAQAWDRQLRCRATLDCGKPDPRGTIMALTEVWNCKYEEDGTVIAHLADDTTRRHAICDGSELYNVHAARPGTRIRQCQACYHLARSGQVRPASGGAHATG